MDDCINWRTHTVSVIWTIVNIYKFSFTLFSTCENVVQPRHDKVEEYCPRCRCRYERRNTKLIAGIVVSLIVLTALLAAYALFLQVLEPLLDRSRIIPRRNHLPVYLFTYSLFLFFSCIFLFSWKILLDFCLYCSYFLFNFVIVVWRAGESHAYAFCRRISWIAQ